MSEVLLLDQQTIRGLIDRRRALELVREAFAKLASGEAQLPPSMSLQFEGVQGEAHVKGAYLVGASNWSIKAATSFRGNPLRGLPASSGMSIVFSAETGMLSALVLDQGYLTELRTGAAGALAADLLASPEVGQLLIVGAGGQARYQLEALLEVRTPRSIVCWARRSGEAQRFADEMTERLGREVAVADDLEMATRTSGIIVTTTSAQSPLIHADWIQPGAHVTAMGSDFPQKQELAALLFARADVIACDDLELAAQNGELHHALAARACRPEQVVTLGELELRRRSGRGAAEEITVCDLVGVGIQDAAVANFVVEEAHRRQLGRALAI
ncbi:MAG TPA: ornithine cyclodeaminase family protein [Candidatus Dormibacteraeota bacterium]|nr:ornithine cyclodeaminase family protein [Candidatus Dormibacteraeota bacterium]